MIPWSEGLSLCGCSFTRGGKPAEGTRIPGKGRGTGPRRVGEQERNQAGTQQQETEAEASTGEGSLGGALHLQVGLTPLFDLGFDLKVFLDKGSPIQLTGSDGAFHPSRSA